MPVVETNTWVLSDDAAANTANLKRVTDFLTTGDGFGGLYSGTADEDPKRFFSFIVWETLEHHKAFMRQPTFPEMGKLVRATVKADAKHVHVEFLEDFIPALTAPTTEIAGLTLKEGATKEKLYRVLDKIADRVNAGNTKYAPATYGVTVEDPNKFYLIIGWDTMKAHVDFVSEASFKPLLDELQSVADVVMFHSSLKKDA